jgi:hypothetical protein
VRAVRGFEPACGGPGGKRRVPRFLMSQFLLFPEDEPEAKPEVIPDEVAPCAFGDPIGLGDVFQAYFECRRTKRSSASAVAFESDYEDHLVALWAEINDGSYEPGRSTAFIVEKPVKREIFAAAFRDRIVHHLVITMMNHLFEKEFIRDSCSCRKGKGTHYGIARVDHFIRQCSLNYSRDCWVLKLDIQGFFMHINRITLFHALRDFLLAHYSASDRDILIELCRKIIHRDPARDCVISGPRNAWEGLPPDKSLFHSPPGCGLPIGNLTSQVFANFYLNGFDHFVKHDLALRHFCRYVDDIILVHEDREYLTSLIPRIRDFLMTKLGLTLHPKKISLQSYRKGIKFLGVMIKPGRICIAVRTKGNFRLSIERHNRLAEDHKPDKIGRAAFLSSVNSYLGMLKHYRTWRLRKHLLVEHVSPLWWKIYRPCRNLRKITARSRE